MKNRVRTSERGVAVLFSLGILGMMTVLALTFASISMTNQTIAKNATKQSSAKEMARGIVERVQYVLNHSGYSGGIITKPTQLQKFFSKENGTSHFDWIWKLGMTGTNIESAFYRTDEICKYTTPGNLPTWQYIKDADNHIIGRFAYVVRATDLPVIDLNTAFLKDNNSNVPGDVSQYKRFGKSLSELDPDIVYEAARLQLGISSPTKFSNISGYSLSGIQSALDSKRMTSYADFESMLPELGDNKLNFSKVIANSYTPCSVKYPEVFLSESGTALYRFDLSRISSVSGETNKRRLVERMVGGTGELPSGWTNADTTNPIKIPWLADFTDSEGGYDDAKHKAKQIAANIVDFFSTDDTPTSDVANNSWFTTTPKYIGLKKTPYLYGFGGKVEMVIKQKTNEKQNSTDPVTYTRTETFSFTPVVYICNFFSCPETLKVGVNATLNFKYKVGSTNKTRTINYSNGEFLSGMTGDTSSVGYNVLDFDNKDDTNEYTVTDSSSSITMTSMEITNLKVGLYYNNKWVDFSSIRATAEPSFGNSDTISTTTTPGNTKTLTFTYPLVFRVSDPRHNLFQTQWAGVYNKENTGTTVPTLFFQSGYADKSLNKTCSEKTPLDHDFAPDPRPYNYNSQKSYDATPRPTSTGATAANNANVYFPSGSTINPWEIGQIHRGHAWQTINLKKHKSSNPTKGGTYSDGDANLLDQLRLSSEISTYGKIPLNEIWGKDQSNIIFEIFQRNARHTTEKKTPVDSAGDTYTTFRNTDFGLVNFFNTRKGYTTDAYFKYRSELAKILTYSSEYHIIPSNPTSDAGREELFTKSVMLFDAEPTFLPRRVYVFGIAQTIQDVNGSVYKAWNNDGSFTNNAGSSNIGKFSSGYRTSSGVDVGGASYPSSGLLSSTFGNYVNGVDKILSEQKVFAILERDYTLTPYQNANTKRPVWKIVRFEYVQ